MNRLNWMLHYGTAPRWKTGVKIIQVRVDLQTIRSDPINNYHHNLKNIPLLDISKIWDVLQQDHHQYRIYHSQVDLCAEELHNSIPATVAIQVKTLPRAPCHHFLNFEFFRETLDRQWPPWVKALEVGVTRDPHNGGVNSGAGKRIMKTIWASMLFFCHWYSKSLICAVLPGWYLKCFKPKF